MEPHKETEGFSPGEEEEKEEEKKTSVQKQCHINASSGFSQTQIIINTIQKAGERERVERKDWVHAFRLEVRSENNWLKNRKPTNQTNQTKTIIQTDKQGAELVNWTND